MSKLGLITKIIDPLFPAGHEQEEARPASQVHSGQCPVLTGLGWRGEVICDDPYIYLTPYVNSPLYNKYTVHKYIFFGINLTITLVVPDPIGKNFGQFWTILNQIEPFCLIFKICLKKSLAY